MKEPSITDLYVQDMTKEHKPLNEAQVEWHHSRFIEFKDKDSRNALFLATMPIVLWLISIHKIPEDHRDDCIQAGNLAILAAISSWRPEAGSTFASWARNQANREIKREHETLTSVLGVDISDIEDELDMDNDWNEDLELEVDLQKLKQGIQGLPGRQRLLMRYTQQGMSVANAADRMGITRQAGGRLYARAIKNLREFF